MKKRDSISKSPYSPPYRKRPPNSPSNHRENKLKSVTGHSPKGCQPAADSCQPPAINLPTVISPPLTMPTSAPTGQQQSDISQIAAASQYHLLYQKFLYQAELDKLANLTSQQNLVNSLLSNPASLPPMNPLFSNSENHLPPVNASINASDFAKLAAFFYQKLQQQNLSPPLSVQVPPTPVNGGLLNTTTEALLNYRKIFSDSKNFPSPFPSTVTSDTKPMQPKPQVHECHWVTAEGYCGKKHYSYDDLMLHLRSHVSNTTDNAPLLSPTAPSTANMCRAQTMDSLNKSFGQPSLRYQPYSIAPVRHHIPMPFSPLV